jgi:acyl-CoA thioesterase YciA
MSEATPPPVPSGELVIRTIAMPMHTNSNGDIFGGWLVSQMDLGGAILARNVTHSRITTAAIDGMSFLNPVYVGDVVSCYATLLKVGRTSMHIQVEVWAQRMKAGELVRVTTGTFVYVAIDENGRPQRVHPA